MITPEPYIAGTISSLSYGIATVLEQQAAMSNKRIDSLKVSHFTSLVRRRLYILGLILDLVGWLSFLVAARRLPLFLCFAFVASSLVVTAIIFKVIYKSKMTSLEKLAICSSVVGMVLLSICAQPSAARKVSKVFEACLIVAPVIIAVIGSVSLKKDNNSNSSVILSILAGLTFAATGVISRIVKFRHITLSLLFKPLIIALIIYGLLGMIYLAAALQRDRVNKVNSVLYSVELTVPTVLGLIFLHDKIYRNDWPIFITGLALMLVGSMVISYEYKVAKAA